MRKSYCLIASIVVASVWATSAVPWVFFVKFNGTYEPLSPIFSNNDGVTSSVLTHGGLYPIPFEVDLRRGYVYSDDETYSEQVGFEDGLLSVSPKTPNFYFNLDFQMRVINGPFQSCKIFNGPVRDIVYKKTKYPIENCMDIELFLLSYDRKKKWAKTLAVSEKDKNIVPKQKEKTGSEETEKNGSKKGGVVVTSNGENTRPKEYGNEANEGKRNVTKQTHIASYNDLKKTGYSLAPPPEYPLVFFAEVNEKLEPLSGWYLGDKHRNLSLFSYGNNSSEPVEFTLKDKSTYTKNPLSSGYTGFNNESSALVFGPTVPRTTLDLDTRGKVLNGPFYSCPKYRYSYPKYRNRVYTIAHQSPEPLNNSCTEANLFLLPYDKKTRSAVIDSPKGSDEWDYEYEFHLLDKDEDEGLDTLESFR